MRSGKQYGHELYNLKSDLSEEKNLIDERPEIVNKLREKLNTMLNDDRSN